MAQSTERSERSHLSDSIIFLYFFALIPEENFLISPSYSLELYIQMDISFFFSFAFHFSSFLSYFKLFQTIYYSANLFWDLGITTVFYRSHYVGIKTNFKCTYIRRELYFLFLIIQKLFQNPPAYQGPNNEHPYDFSWRRMPRISSLSHFVLSGEGEQQDNSKIIWY